MFPLMMNGDIEKVLNRFKDNALAWKLAGAGGGGYLIFVGEKDIPGSFKIKIRVKEWGM
jgi:galactokinase/mevalonate kinase-like predicted kinase